MAEHLLDEIERIEERAVHEDAAVAQGEEFRDLEMHDAVVVALASRQTNCVVATLSPSTAINLISYFRLGIALLLGPDRLGEPVLAVLVAEMRKQFDRRVVMVSSSSSQQACAAATSPE